MKLDRTEMLYGGIAGALIGAGYQIGRAWFAGDVASAFDFGLGAAAAIGALAGILALALRGG